jgi:transketolase
MRNAFLEELYELATRDERIVFITGDLGFSVVENFMEDLPKQFINAGVAEQNMTGMAAGMALSGKIVFTYSIANFPTLRCLEQIRNDVCYHNANVTIVGIGGGVAYGSLGTTHHATEDLAVMRAMPEMKVIAPGDPLETRAATRFVVAHPGPCYLRLGKAGEPIVHKTKKIDFQIGRAITMRDGSDVTLMSTGGMLQTAVGVGNELAGRGIETRVLSMHSLKPLATEAILAAARETRAIATLEEHSVIGGLGSAVAEVLAEADGVSVPFQRIGFPSAFSPYIGSQDFLRAQHGLTVEQVSERLERMLKATKRSQQESAGCMTVTMPAG